MFPKDKRLKKEKDFKKIYRYGRRAHGDFFILHFLKSGDEKSRFAVVISNKVVKKATKRNALKRKVREILKSELPKSHFDFVFILKKDPGLEFSELKKKIAGLLNERNITFS